MMKALKKWVKRVSPFALSKNHRYDILCKKIILSQCKKDSNCIDVGAHEGECFDLFLKSSPRGTHFAFEPIPYLYRALVTRYKKHSNIQVHNCAVSSFSGSTTFNHVISNPAYSGIKKRKYDRKHESDETLIVAQTNLDSIIPENVKIDFIKLDVEGAEYDVIRGAKKLIKSSQPLIVFEFGIGGSDIYGATPEKMFTLLNEMEYSIYLLDEFLKDGGALTSSEFNAQFFQMKNYYFIAALKAHTSKIVG